MPCDIPPLAVKLATAIGLSMFLQLPFSMIMFENQKRCRCKALMWSPPQVAISTLINGLFFFNNVALFTFCICDTILLHSHAQHSVKLQMQLKPK